ncbi:flagellar hook-length control protein FliK, partial [Halarcobacter sp.]|uniref:flagellar hook-length control protein FliK n=1 Tax=Halarcobacter sp. TaxID=2321133 RepID=UPI003A8EE0A5
SEEENENKVYNKTQKIEESKAKEPTEIKENINKNPELDSVSGNKESKKEDEKSNDEKIKQTQPSLMDQLLSKTKKDLESKDKETTLSKVEEKRESKESISQVVNETKKDLTNKSIKEVEKNSLVENKDIKEVINSKEEKAVDSIELKDASKNTTLTSVEKKESLISKSNSSNNEENKAIDIKDEKLNKTSLEETKEVNNNEEKTNKKISSDSVKLEQNTIKEEVKTNDTKVISKEEKTINIESSTKKTEINTSTNDSKKEPGNLAKLDKEAIVQSEQKVEIKKDTLKQENLENPKDAKIKSLMDQLINTNKPKTVSSEALETNVNSSSKNGDLLTNIYLGSRKNSIYNQMLSTKSEAVKVVKEGKTADDIKKGADKLDLNAKDLSVTKEAVSQKKEEFNKQVDTKIQRDSIDRMVMDQNNKKSPISSETTSKLNLSSSNTQETTVNLTVSPNVALTIQNRIIGAQQQMSSMMSDIARNMYENYKPPITAFRINLFPAQLGQIAILMKSDRDSGISISMNMSNSATLDAVVENQGSLREAINRNFNNQTDVNFEFGMQGESQNNSSSGNNEGNQEQASQQQHSSTDILEAVNDNKNVADDLNYL